MSENSTAATDLTSQYTAQVANDLERNVKEQERITAEIAALREQLTVLQHDHAILVSMQQALGLTAAPAEPAAPSEPAAASRPAAAQESEAAEPAATTGSEAPAGGATVPAPRRRSGAKSGADKPKRGRTTGPRTASGKAAAKPSAVKSPTAKAPSVRSAGTKASAVKTKKQTKQQTQAEAEAPTSRVVKADGPTSRAAKAAKPAKPAKAEGPKLVELVRGHLAEHREPRSAAEVATALGQAHPDRTIRTTVVRSTLEGLVARNQAQRTKQGTSVFYTAPDAAPRTADGEAGAAS
jgi:hypothetical protein